MVSYLPATCTEIYLPNQNDLIAVFLRHVCVLRYSSGLKNSFVIP